MELWLFILLLVLMILVILLVLVMVSAIEISVHLIMRSKEYRVIAGIRMLYGLVNLRYELPFRLNNKGIEYMDKSVKPDTSHASTIETEDMMSDHQRELRVADYMRLLRATDGFYDWLLNTVSMVKLYDIRWSTAVALDNAAETAVAAGAVWGVKHTIMGWLSYHIRMMSLPELQVIPEFNGAPQISTEFNCMAKISVAKIFRAGLALVVRVLRVKGGIKVWQNTLFKAS